MINPSSQPTHISTLSAQLMYAICQMPEQLLATMYHLSAIPSHSSQRDSIRHRFHHVKLICDAIYVALCGILKNKKSGAARARYELGAPLRRPANAPRNDGGNRIATPLTIRARTQWVGFTHGRSRSLMWPANAPTLRRYVFYVLCFRLMSFMFYVFKIRINI